LVFRKSPEVTGKARKNGHLEQTVRVGRFWKSRTEMPPMDRGSGKNSGGFPDRGGGAEAGRIEDQFSKCSARRLALVADAVAGNDDVKVMALPK